MKSSFKRARSAGFSLIELLLVIGFIAGALVLAFITYPKVQATNRANTESQHITVISGGIKNLYTTAKNFGSLTNTVLINAKIIPDDLSVTAPNITNIWGGAITVGPDTATSRYTITYTAVPAAECSKLVTGVGVNFMKVSAGPSGAPVVIFDRLAGGTGGAVNVDPATVTTNCQAGGDNNTIVFVGN